MFAITFLGPNNHPVPNLPHPFHVRRYVLLDALRWLKVHNPLYHDIVINETALEQYPENDVPRALQQIMRTSDDLELLRQEQSGVGIEDDELDVYLREEIAQFEIDPIEDGVNVDDTGSCLFGIHFWELVDCIAEISFDTFGMVDLEGNRISDAEFMSHAMDKVIFGVESYNIPTGSQYANEYRRLDEFQQPSIGTNSNPNHILGAFPVLFPYGLGGPEVDRPIPISYQSHAQWALQYEDRRFRYNHRYLFEVYGVMVKRMVGWIKNGTQFFR
jgi:hypothetical protein